LSRTFKTPAVRVETLRPVILRRSDGVGIDELEVPFGLNSSKPFDPTEAPMKITTLVPTLMLAAGLALPASPARAMSTTWQECQVVEVRTTANRVHVQCALLGEVFGPYFAVPTSSAAEATRLVTLGTAAMTGGGRLQILLGLDDFTGPSFGCSIHDCRRPLEVILRK
jgi:hypothetical protein